MKIANIYDVKTNLSKYLLQVESGEEVIIGRYGKPVARIVPYVSDPPQYHFGGLKGQIWIADDFDAPNDEIVALFEGTK